MLRVLEDISIQCHHRWWEKIRVAHMTRAPKGEMSTLVALMQNFLVHHQKKETVIVVCVLRLQVDSPVEAGNWVEVVETQLVQTR